jgi:predicted O-methyltransferase YrrM
MSRSIRRFARQAWISSERLRLIIAGEQRLARSLRARECPLALAIEKFRETALVDSSPLVDGTLGPPAIYDEGQTIADVCLVSKPESSARLLYSMAAEFRPMMILELGTNIGISSAYLAASGGRVTSFDASPYRLRIAEALHQSLSLNVKYVPGLFEDTLQRELEHMRSIDMAFIDGHHQYGPTINYFEMIAAKAAPDCLFVFDDIRWSSGMKRAWRELRTRSAFRAVADLHDMGVAVLRPS